ncbi:MAG: Hsp20/alpha crystallin family protein [Steroidobacteraceae bacterium]
MSTLQQIRQGLSRAWGSVQEGWQEFRDLAGDALTRFQPRSSNTAVTPSGSSEDNSSLSRNARWGLLAAEVEDTGDQIGVSLEAPGLEPEDVDIEVVGDVLIVRGEKNVSREQTRGSFHVTERAYGHFERAIRLPATSSAWN